ncbi:gamma carbonic anhydrase family protein [Methanolobus sp. WCC4]|uniref:gamma carbonic anhydrase family protein n=1 Tax=Methanolobus sp. WCC4 TaxID=3125784 RepID=UPI0030F4F02F
MARYCKVCGAKSGRCNHIVVDFGERDDSGEKSKDDSKSTENDNSSFLLSVIPYLIGDVMIITFKSNTPEISPTAFVASNAAVIGDVTISDGSSVWFGAVIRGDADSIHIGKRTSIQDNVVIHTDAPQKVEIGDDVSVGHGAVLHGCRISDNVLIGMNATVLNGAEIGENCIIGANALVPPGKKIPAGSLVVGVPGKVQRQLSDEDIAHIKENAEEYVRLSEEYRMMQDK